MPSFVTRCVRKECELRRRNETDGESLRRSSTRSLASVPRQTIGCCRKKFFPTLLGLFSEWYLALSSHLWASERDEQTSLRIAPSPDSYRAAVNSISYTAEQIFIHVHSQQSCSFHDALPEIVGSLPLRSGFRARAPNFGHATPRFTTGSSTPTLNSPTLR